MRPGAIVVLVYGRVRVCRTVNRRQYARIVEPVGEAFLKNVTLWWGCAFTLAVYIAQGGSLAMIAIGFGYVVLAWGGAMTRPRAPNVWRPRCAREASLRSFWPGSVAWLGVQGVCIFIYIAGVICAYGGIKHALHVGGARPTRCGALSHRSHDVVKLKVEDFAGRMASRRPSQNGGVDDPALVRQRGAPVSLDGEFEDLTDARVATDAARR